MTTGHLNAGYEEIVSQNKLALNNPSGARTAFQRKADELKDIRDAAKAVWADRDNYETTYGRYHKQHDYDKQIYRPSSPSRKNNPHPTKVFLTTRMAHIPGCFDDNDFAGKSRPKIKVPEYHSNHKQIIPSTVSNYTNANQYIQSLHPDESSAVEDSLKKAGIDTTKLRRNNSSARPMSQRNNLSYENSNFETKSMFNLHNNTTGDSEYRSEFMGKSSADELEHRVVKPGKDSCLQTNATNPYLYNDYRVYREKYANNDHGVPNPDAKKPSRGEFLIHPDWHARLKHHRLPCNC